MRTADRMSAGRTGQRPMFLPEADSVPRCAKNIRSTSAVNDQPNGIGQLRGNVGNDISPQEISKRETMGGADHQEINTEGGSEIENGGGRIITHCIDWHHWNVALAAEL